MAKETTPGEIINKATEQSSKASYILVLTHDVDVLSLKELPILSRTFLGFAYRCLVVNLRRVLTHRLRPLEFLDSLKCVVLLPFIKLGFAKDPWHEGLKVLLQIEKRHGVLSTIYFIPFSRQPGHTPERILAPNNRAAYYKVEEHRELLRQLEEQGWEVGVHGIDAYLNLKSAKEELEVFRSLINRKDKIGIRMHWLYHKGEETWRILDEAGYTYDATFGWNDRVGFRDNQYVPFKPEGVRNLIVLPLSIQDGAILGEWHQFPTNEQAWRQVERILGMARQHNAVVAILWHNNSFVAPRYWGWLYEKTIEKAKADGAYICRAIDAVDMFRRGEL